MEESVILIVKAPNQQIEDQTIQCEMNWTIKMLKGHLSEVYPSKPRSEDQKLIYSGQLLTDNVTLKDVLRSYEGQQNHTVHLVCSPPKETLRSPSASCSKPAAMPSTQAPRPQEPQFQTPSNENLRRRVPTLPPQPQWPPGYTPPTWPPVGGVSYDSATMAQQMAWMQQAYAQYMTQYMQLMAAGGVPNVMQPPGVSPTAGHPPQEQAPVNPPPANVEEEDLRGNRDWLDWFYIMSRTLVLFSIVYFYSSPVRFFVVFTLGIIMYLYQVGFFRAVQRLDQPEEPPVPATPPPTPDNNNSPPPPAPAPPAPPSTLALTWAAFSSFFLSLIPEQPNVL
ncbi:homocysteine-responsive endoplasmic reticulum-resident ubiquitin-like domain member 2 protein isoform X1 [Macrosteles quadrilineatus]|uniref:homocysteine-responsive endoplasmic reticulum-resident ubiquitin-like domain member 2 protein isoform X1 n=2 Tax=Macrosteles quadrilineatus TaxID=74068 RepID=UPI0023E1CF46|nr:homocysteine-responsive endoplasmic reticulum-resident ubiquitin-like domain member 2 protein isoform X1 [Macrosteles quadrilineatus]